MGFGAERTERHPCRGEPAADFLDRLDLLDWHGAGGARNKLEQVARRVRCRGQNGIDVSLVVLGLVRTNEAVEILDDRRGDGV